MQAVLWIMLGGGLGSLLRYWISLGVHKLSSHAFPYGTLSVNVIGSFLMGFLSIFVLERLNETTPFFRYFLLVGFLGGFTTFSAFSMETLDLLQSGDIIKGCLNILLSFSFCLLAVGLGVLLARQV